MFRHDGHVLPSPITHQCITSGFSLTNSPPSLSHMSQASANRGTARVQQACVKRYSIDARTRTIARRATPSRRRVLLLAGPWVCPLGGWRRHLTDHD